jgi:hypothetical protein
MLTVGALGNDSARGAGGRFERGIGNVAAEDIVVARFTAIVFKTCCA